MKPNTPGASSKTYKAVEQMIFALLFTQRELQRVRLREPSTLTGH